MGYSISRELGEKLERNRAEGRLCAGTGRHCARRATYRVEQETWLYRIGEGKSDTTPLPMCGTHAREFYPGYRGVNFVVTGVVKF